MYAPSHTAAAHGNLVLNCQQTALPSPGYGLNFTMVMLSPWLLFLNVAVACSLTMVTRKPSQRCLIPADLLSEQRFAAGWAFLQPVCRRYWTQYNGWFHFNGLIGQRQVPTALRSSSARRLCGATAVTVFSLGFQTLHMQSW